jgi:hypothetical protein
MTCFQTFHGRLLVDASEAFFMGDSRWTSYFIARIYRQLVYMYVYSLMDIEPLSIFC